MIPDGTAPAPPCRCAAAREPTGLDTASSATGTETPEPGSDDPGAGPTATESGDADEPASGSDSTGAEATGRKSVPMFNRSLTACISTISTRDDHTDLFVFRISRDSRLPTRRMSRSRSLRKHPNPARTIPRVATDA